MSVTNPCSVFCCIENGNNAGGDVECAVGTTETMYYVHKDYLGSISAITDASGNLVESLSYDPWGRRRKPADWTDYNVTSTLFDRGFTGHEHLDHFGLINMNGRVYDPFLARFLSPDPFVQAPSYSQNYNRYSYAWNNPLKYTDPSGYSVILDENTTNIPYIAGGSGFAGNWYAWATDRHSMSGQLHWQAQYRSGATNAALLGQGAFDNFYGKGAYNSMIGSHIDSKNQRNAATGKVSGSGLITDPGSIAMIADWMKSGFHLSIVSAFGRTTLVGSMGALGSYRYSDGGLIFSNLTAGMVVGEAGFTATLKPLHGWSIDVVFAIASIGGSLELGEIFDPNTGATYQFRNKGLAYGVEASISLNYILILPKTGFNISHLEGTGWGFSGSYYISGAISGNSTPALYGGTIFDSYIMIRFGIGPGYGGNITPNNYMDFYQWIPSRLWWE